MSRTLLVKGNVGDPETGRSYLNGEVLSVGEDVTEEEANRLLARHPERVEEGAATEAAVREAQEAGVDLASVSGSGDGGKVTKADVDKAKK